MILRRAVFCLLCCCLALAAWGQSFLLEHFNSGIPAAWTVQNGGTTAHTWAGTVGGYNGQSLDGTEFAFVNSDGAGNIPPIWLHEGLVSPTLNASSANSLYLEFDHYFRGLGQTDSGHVEVWNGLAWLRLASYRNNTGNFGAPDHVQLNLSVHINAALQVRFVYDDDTLWAWYWAVDNVHIYAPLNNDAALSGAISPIQNGRAYTANALSNAETVSVNVRNFGTDTIPALPIAFRVDGGPVTGPETLSVPLPPNQTLPFTFSATADLSAVGSHLVEVWTALGSDFNRANDTFRIALQQWDNPPLIFPHCQSFELAPDTTIQSEMIGLRGVPEMDFSTSQPSMGRLRTFAGSGFPRTGIRALSFDSNPSSTPDAQNFTTFTYNLAGLNASTDQVLMDLALMEHGDEIQLRDSIWVRGCDLCPWHRIIGWNTLTSGINGNYFFINGFDLSAALVAAGQNFSSTFQIRVGQEDNFNTTTLIGNDGLTIDDLCLRRIFEWNALPVAVFSPVQGGCGDSLSAVSVILRNGGRDTLDSIPVRVSVSGAGSASFADTLLGPLLPNAQDTLFLGFMNTYGGGAFDFEIVTLLPGDEYPTDDTLLALLDLLGLPPAPTILGDTVCAGNSAILHVQSPPSGLEWYWYDAAVGGNELGIGDSLQTGPINVPTAFYAEARHIRKGRLGPLDNGIGNGAAHAVYAEGQVFDAFQEFVLDSVTVYPADTGWVHVALFDSSGLLLAVDSSLVMPAQAFQRMQLHVGIEVPVGIAHELRASGTNVPSLWRNSTGAAYPYSHANVATITAAVNALAGYYYFFYDWRITYPDCPGPRIAVQIDTATVPAIAAFSDSILFLDVQFTNQSSFAQQFLWDFGDGNSSSLASPQHSYATDSTYAACLIAYSPCGNDTLCQTITVDCAPLNASFSRGHNQTQVIFASTTLGAVINLWDFGDGSPVQQGNPVTHVFNPDSVYWVCLTAVNVCQDSATTCDSVPVCGPIACNFNAVPGVGGLSVSFTPVVTGFAASYFWDFGDGNTSAAMNPTHVFAGGGTHVVTLQVTNLCGQTATMSNSIVLVGNVEPRMDTWRVWPNPNTGVAYVDALGAERVQVQDAQGRILSLSIVAEKESQWRIDLRSLPAGIYFLRVESEWGTRHFRLVLQP